SSVRDSDTSKTCCEYATNGPSADHSAWGNRSMPLTLRVCWDREPRCRRNPSESLQNCFAPTYCCLPGSHRAVEKISDWFRGRPRKTTSNRACLDMDNSAH